MKKGFGKISISECYIPITARPVSLQPNCGQRKLRLRKRTGEYFDRGITETSGTKLQARSSLNLQRPIQDTVKMSFESVSCFSYRV